MKLTPNKSAAVLAVALLGGGFLISGLDIPAKGLEGNPGKPYMDIGGIWTDCYGNTKNVRRDFVRTESECRALLGGEAERIATLIQSKTDRRIPPSTLAAFISFTYNVGDSAFLKSTAFKRFNEGKTPAACRELLRWVYVKGVYSRGLFNRRMVEYNVCIKGEDTSWVTLS